MSEQTDEVVFECALDAPPEKVWRALTIPEYLARWLRPADDVEIAMVTAVENQSLSYRWRDTGKGAIAGVEDSLLTFELTPTTDGGTWFKLTHGPLALPAAANTNHRGPLMRAA